MPWLDTLKFCMVLSDKLSYTWTGFVIVREGDKKIFAEQCFSGSSGLFKNFK